jgi:putative oxidoreductase
MIHSRVIWIEKKQIDVSKRCGLPVLESLRFFKGEHRVHGLEKLRPLALLFLRLGLGAIFIYHGYPKLFAHTHEFMFDAANRDGLPGYFGRLAGLVEVLGGALLMLGLFTRIAGLPLTIELAAVLWMGHELFVNPRAVGRYELPLACAAGAFALATFGAGSVSLDAAFSRGGARPVRKAKA